MRLLFSPTIKIFLILSLTKVWAGPTEHRGGKQISLFTVVQFPNDECTSPSSSTTQGTCLTSSECTSKGGSGSGSCAAGFGVCCVISTSTCGSSISTNTTYIRNPGYPTTYTPTAGSTCTFTINKESDDICQLRLDFQTFTGFTATSVGACTDTFAVEGQTSVNPPSICGTNTGYHMYAEFGATSTDSVKLTMTMADVAAKSWNILARQIACTATWRAPTDCTQYFTGVSGTVKSYNFGQMLQSMDYENCIRTEAGYCRIQWQESTVTSPDPFGILSTTPAATGADAGGAADATLATEHNCYKGHISIPDMSMNGLSSLAVPLAVQSYQDMMCGAMFGIEGQDVPVALVSAKLPFRLGVYSIAADDPGTGFSLDYTQLPC